MKLYDAKSYKHEFVVEHLLIALLTNASVREAMDACNADIVNLKSDLKSLLTNHTNYSRRKSKRIRNSTYIKFSKST